jgi:hypothetical protein
MPKFGRKVKSSEKCVVMLSVFELSCFSPTDLYLCLENITYAHSKQYRLY